MCISGLISDCLSSLFVVLTVSSRVEGGRDDKVDNCLFDTDVVVIIRNQHQHRTAGLNHLFIGQANIPFSSFSL